MNTQNNQYLEDYVEKYRDIKEKWLKDFNKSCLLYTSPSPRD